MSPASFLQRPMRWLRAISRYRATTSGGPNFAYDSAPAGSPRRSVADLDLTSWRGGVQRRRAGARRDPGRFARAFAPAGFRPRRLLSLLRPGGGDAVRLRRHARRGDPRPRLRPRRPGARCGVAGGRGALADELVGCGRPWLGQNLEIVDPETRRRARRAGSARSGWPGPAWPAATGAAPRRRSATFARPAAATAADPSCAPATSGSWPAASCSSPAAART